MDYLDYSTTTLKIELHKLEEHYRKLEFLQEENPESKEFYQESLKHTSGKIGNINSAIRLLENSGKREQ